MHSSYQRSLDERPLGSRRVVVRFRVRRYFCDRKWCSRRTFVEQVPGLTERHRRSSTGLTEWLRSITVELGGCPAARLCRRLRLAAGRTRLLRLLTAPPVQSRAPRVLGVDEFAFRKGCTYGTVLVDVEAGQVVDVLPDRTSETFAAWLRDHPGAEIICRDRATAYTKAVKEAAPNALEIAEHIARRPGGLVALAIQYGHLRTSVAAGHAARSRAGIHDLFDVETARATHDRIRAASTTSCLPPSRPDRTLTTAALADRDAAVMGLQVSGRSSPDRRQATGDQYWRRPCHETATARRRAPPARCL